MGMRPDLAEGGSEHHSCWPWLPSASSVSAGCMKPAWIIPLTRRSPSEASIGLVLGRGYDSRLHKPILRRWSPWS